MEETFGKPTPSSPARRRRFRIGALIVLALAVALILWLVLRDNDDSSSSSAKAVSVDQIRNLAESVGHPVYWVGPRDGYTYELTRPSNGAIIIRYLPEGVAVGDDKPHLSVATYPFSGAFPAIRKAARKSDSDSFKIPDDGIAVFAKRYPQSIHVAYPGGNHQVEVYDPVRGAAATMLRAGQLTALGKQAATHFGLARRSQVARPLPRPPDLLGRLEKRLDLRADPRAGWKGHHPIPSAGGEGRHAEAVSERRHVSVPRRVPVDPDFGKGGDPGADQAR